MKGLLIGNATDFLVSRISKQVEKKGMVVWYDPERLYANVPETLNPLGVPLLKFCVRSINLSGFACERLNDSPLHARRFVCSASTMVSDA